MNMVFNSIDGKYIKSRPEFMGDIQPKYWFTNNEQTVLVKRQHSQKVNGQAKKSKMFNHFGEYFGYLLAQKAGVNTCPVDLITLHDTKNKYGKSLYFYTACASRKVAKSNQNIMLGEHIVGRFAERYKEKYNQIVFPDGNINKYYTPEDIEDNIDVVISAIATQTMDYERTEGIRTEAEIKADIDENLRDAFDMFVYDCVFGNNDRHSQNWAMLTDLETGRVKLYPLYDNERVLGLSRTEAELKQDVASNELSKRIEKTSTSRMGIAPKHSAMSYKVVLEHLVNKYPQYALPAIKKITDRVTVQDIEELYNSAMGITKRSEAQNELTEMDELPQEYKIYGTTLYAERREFARDLLEKSRNGKITHYNKSEDDLILA